MAATPSVMIPLGSKAVDFTLPDTVSGKQLSLSALKGEKATVIMFICNHCPYVRHVNGELVRTANQYQKNGIKFIAISSNDVTQYPDDSPAEMKKVAEKLKYPFPYLYDETQQVARNYDAACTPDFFVYDTNLKLAYRGQFDDARPGNHLPVTGKDLKLALDALLEGRSPASDQKPGIGCSIKWKK